jgi:1-acyl-sn-glycerol-3-phosphate acyltransferase
MPWWLPGYLRRYYGLVRVEFRGEELLRASLDAGHGVFLAPNHARPCDPMVVGLLAARLGRPSYCVASWHVFTSRPRWQQWFIRQLGTFSIHRWGMDREALKACIAILTEARRPLLLFPEGMITRTNDRLGTLLDGTGFIAHTAAKQRAKATPPGKVVIHPLGLRYLFEGDIDQAAGAVLDEIEPRLTWQPQRSLPLIERILKVGAGLLSLKEIEYLGTPQSGTVEQRLRRLSSLILEPMERKWLNSVQSASVVERVKRLRTAMLPELAAGNLSEADAELRWRHLADCYLAQQIDCYPGNYLSGEVTVDRILETVERFEEDLTDTARVHRPMRVIVQIGNAISVDVDRPRGDDPLMTTLEERLCTMLAELQRECRPYSPKSR